MYIIIAGGGLIGRGLVKRLVESKHDVVVIDQDASICEDIYARYGAVTVTGKATEMDTLELARIDKCDVAIGAMSEDSANMGFALLANHFKVPQIIVRMRDGKYDDVYKSVGVHVAAHSTDILIDQILISVETPQIQKIINLGSLEFNSIHIDKTSAAVGKDIIELTASAKFPSDCHYVCTYAKSQENYLLAGNSYLLEAGDKVFVCGSGQAVRSCFSFLKG